jgi:hypothetical protein
MGAKHGMHPSGSKDLPMLAGAASIHDWKDIVTSGQNLQSTLMESVLFDECCSVSQNEKCWCFVVLHYMFMLALYTVRVCRANSRPGGGKTRAFEKSSGSW